MNSSIKCDCGLIVAGNTAINDHMRNSKKPGCKALRRPDPGWSTLCPSQIAKNLAKLEEALRNEHFDRHRLPMTDPEASEETTAALKTNAGKKTKVGKTTKVGKKTPTAAPVAPIPESDGRKRPARDDDEATDETVVLRRSKRLRK